MGVYFVVEMWCGVVWCGVCVAFTCTHSQLRCCEGVAHVVLLLCICWTLAPCNSLFVLLFLSNDQSNNMNETVDE